MNKITLYRIFVVLLIFLVSLSPLTVLDVKAQTENTWTSLAPMQQPRGALGVTVANNKIYAIGGTAGGTHSIAKTNEEYNPTTNTWTYKTQMPTPRSHFAITTLENKIYCIGGNTYTLDPYESILTGTNEVYDPLTDSWETKAPLPTPKKAITANVIDNKIYVVGDESNELWMYTPETDQWTRKPPMSFTPTIIRGGWSCSSAVVNNKLHVSWGHHQVYDPKTETWSSASSTATPYYGSAGATIGINSSKRFYVFGVDDEFWYLSYPNSVSLSYDSKTDSWTTFDPMPTKRVAFGVAVVDDQIYTIGGYTIFIGNNIDSSGIVERYTPLEYGLAPVIIVTSPENKSYGDMNILLSVELDKVSDIKYSLDGHENITFAKDIILSNLEAGEHKVIVYATDLAGHTGVSETIYFTIEPFPTTIVLALIILGVVAGVGFILYFKKRKT